MSDLQIPAAAIRAVRTIDDAWDNDTDAALVAEVIAKPVVAAELRRLAERADELRMELTPVGDSVARALAVRSFATFRDVLLDRANELGGDPS